MQMYENILTPQLIYLLFGHKNRNFLNNSKLLCRFFLNNVSITFILLVLASSLSGKFFYFQSCFGVENGIGKVVYPVASVDIGTPLAYFDGHW